jgi:GntR family transcriptional repressor for pyruvate dehydrogenase complex
MTKSYTQAQLIAQTIIQSILEKKYTPGSYLPAERDFAKNLGVNRGTLREALRILESMKIIAIKRGKGIEVMDYKSQGTIDLLPHFLKLGCPGMDFKVVVTELLTMRRTIVQEIIRLAACHGDPAKMGTLRKEVEAISRHMTEPMSFAKMDLIFLQKLTQFSGILPVIWLYNTLMNIPEEIITLFADLVPAPANYCEVCMEILQSIERRNYQEAQRVYREYSETHDHQMLSLLTSFGTPAGDEFLKG